MKMTANIAPSPINGSPTRPMRLPARARRRRASSAGPLAHKDALSLHAYVGADPVNFTDPLGLESEIVVTGRRIPKVRIDGYAGVPGYGRASGGSGNGGGRPGPNDDIDGDGEPDPDIVVTARKSKDKGWGFDFFLARVDVVMRSIGIGLIKLEEALKPPEGRRSNETFEGCVRRVAGTAPGAVVAGGAGVAASGPFLGYPRAGISRGGRGTSLTSWAARASFGNRKMSTGALGTGSMGGAVGRTIATASAVGGAALAGMGVGQLGSVLNKVARLAGR